MRIKKADTKLASLSPSDKSDLDNSEKLTFALDIGTRSVVGILGVNRGSIFHVIDYEQRFHTERAMRDGQIEDIESVSKVIKIVKEELEKRHNCQLCTVSIAAAGRALKTKRITYEQELDPTEEITYKLLQAVEYCAVGLAQEEFFEQTKSSENDTTSFYCVGYSVIGYRLDNYPISTLVGHKGKKIIVELIAAFLPHNVVQSLFTVMRMNNLTVDNLTLEPIAAINVIVPKDIRLLNIALVDIGAGTSDIAISKNGSIVAYDMVTTAGDEITETIMQNYITNFETAENIKLLLGNEEKEITFQDILGNTRKELKSKLLKIIRPSVLELGQSISTRILEINEIPPLAIFLVGGGSQIPGLCQTVAQCLKLSPEFVAIGGNQPFKNIALFTDKLQNPEFITPVGIGALSSFYKGCDFFSITVNEKKLMLLNYGNAKVLDALLLASIKPQNLIGISPRSLTYYVNGIKQVKRGKSSIPGELFVNDQVASIDTKIQQGDIITIKPAIDGTQPEIPISQIKESYDSLLITIDEMETKIDPIFSVKGKIVDDNYIIKSMDNLFTSLPKNLEEIFDLLNVNLESLQITLNGEPAYGNSSVKSGDIIYTGQKYDQTISNDLVIENNADIIASDEAVELLNSSSQQSMANICINGDWKQVAFNDKKQIFFFDMLNYVDIDAKNPQGDIVLKLNGSQASYSSLVTEGDKVEIRWNNSAEDNPNLND